MYTGEVYGSYDMDGDNIPDVLKYTEIFNKVVANVADMGIPGRLRWDLYILPNIF